MPIVVHNHYVKIDCEPFAALLVPFLEKAIMTLTEVKDLATKTAADVQTLIAADKAKIADLQAKLDAATALADQPSVDAIGATLSAIDAAVTPTP